MKKLDTIVEDSNTLLSSTHKPRFTMSCDKKIPILKTKRRNIYNKVAEELHNKEASLKEPGSGSISSSYKPLPPISKQQFTEQNANTEDESGGIEIGNKIEIKNDDKIEETKDTVDPSPYSKWIRILDLHKNLPENNEGSLEQEDVDLLQEALHQSHDQHQGYLSPGAVVQTCLSQIIVHNMCLDQGGIRQAIHAARSQDFKMGLVNIDKFIQALTVQLFAH